MKLSLFSRILASSVICLTLASPARATNDGDLCNGFMMLICIPVVLTAAAVEQLKPASAQKKMADAIQDGNLKQVKLLLARNDTFKADQVLKDAARIYLESQDKSNDADRLHVVQYLIEEGGVDVSGALGTTLLQSTVDSLTFLFQPRENGWKKRLQLARLTIAHGASAKDVKLGTCQECENDQELLPLLISHGASPNGAVRNMSPTLLEVFIDNDQFAAAERLLRLGADPNGANPYQDGTYGQSMLFRLVSACSPGNADWQQCIDSSTGRISFAVAHGADPNGQATMKNKGECLTPYDVALKKQNAPLAQALLKLGASADYGARCKQL